MGCPDCFPRSGASPRSRLFRRRYFPHAGASEWNDWQWQLQHRIRDCESLSRVVDLTEDERSAVRRHTGPLPVSITPYYLSLIDPAEPRQPLRRTVIPVSGEFLHSPGENGDPLGEDHQSPVRGLVHRYPDRVLFMVTDFCSTNCRYCTRSRMVGTSGERCFGVDRWEDALAYIREHPAIRDVLVSGGDPLTLPDEKLEWLLQGLRAIPHVEFIRVGTKAPVVLPQRVTPSLVRMLKRYHPLWMSIHFTHPDELTPETARACARLAGAGIPLGSQTVLLAGINDDVETMRRLMHGLLRIRVRPYYLYQCDPIPGSSHFRTPAAKGVEIVRSLRGFTTGYAVPTFVIDAPGGGGKIPIAPDYVEGASDGGLLLRSFDGGIYRYPALTLGAAAEEREPAFL